MIRRSRRGSGGTLLQAGWMDEVDDLNHDEKHHFQVNRNYLMKIKTGVLVFF